MPNINAMKSFLIAADTLSFSRTAEQRNTVQSAVSAHIKKLEDELGCRLFKRGRGQIMTLTPEGHAYVVYARRITNLNAEAVQSIRQTKVMRSIKLGTTITLSLSVIADALRQFTQQNKSVQIQVDCDRSDALLQKLDDGEIDVAFMMDQGKRPGRDFVENMPLEWICGPNFNLSSKEDVPLVFLTDGRDLRHFAFEALDHAGRNGYLAHLSSHPVGIRSFVMADLALTVMPRVAVVEPLKVAPPMANLPALKSVALSLYRKPAFNSDIDVLSSIVHKLLIDSNKSDKQNADKTP